jgi:hypothetical protein
MKQEIWFEKVLWSYMPCHWKGLVFTVILAASTVLVIFSVKAVLSYFELQRAEDLSFLLIPAAVLYCLRVAKRHS